MCTLCEIPLNAEVTLSVNWAFCGNCNAESTNAFPRKAINLGFNLEGKHEFVLLEGHVCICGYSMKGIEFCCDDDGCVVELWKVHNAATTE